MAIQCWFCDKITEIKNDDYGDHRCPFCNVEISIYDLNKQYCEEQEKPKAADTSWLNRGEDMLNYNDEKYQGKFVYLPPIGKEIVIEIKELREVKSDNPKFNFSENVPVLMNGEPVIDDDGEPVTKKKDLGYHIEAELTNGKILSVTSIAAFINVFKKYEINDGDKVKISHQEKGMWIVEKL